MTVIVVLFVLYGTYIQSHSIEKSIKNDAGVMADLIFQNLFTVMKNGGDKQKLDALVMDLHKSIPEVSIKIVKPDEIFSFSLGKEVFLSKEASIERQDDRIVFAKPIVYSQKCLACHTASKSNEVAAVTMMEFPILNLQISLKEIIMMASILFVLIISVFFIIWYIFLRKYFVEPIEHLVSQMKEISSHEDLHAKVFIDTSIKEVKQIEKAFNKQNEELMHSYNNLETISNTDPLTGIFNRKKFDEYADIIIKNSKRYNHELSLIMIDLNKFKFINDTYGHHVGDDILKMFSTIVNASIRESDHFFRTGGDEFILLLSDTSEEGAHNIIRKIELQLLEKTYNKNNLNIEISASFGVVQYSEELSSIQDMLTCADARMYEDKKRKKQEV